MQAFKDKNVNKVVEVSKNDFYSTEEANKKDVQELFSDPNNNIETFEILAEEQENDSIAKFKVRINYINGRIEEGDLKTKQFGNNLKVWIEDEDVNIDVIEKGEEFPIIRPFVQLTTWNSNLSYTGNNAPQYTYSSPFSATGVTYVDLNYKQSLPTSFTVVKNNIFGNSAVSYTANRSANSTTGPNSVILNLIPGESFNNVKLRVMATGSTGWSFGEVYAY